MLRLAAMGWSGFVLVSCGLPASVVVAGYAADGVSFGYTRKTVGDHALSAALARDCAVWRVVHGDAVCVQPETSPAGQTEISDAPPDGHGTAHHPELLYARPEPHRATAVGHRIDGEANPW